MFPWSTVFYLEPKVPGRRSSEELRTTAGWPRPPAPRPRSPRDLLALQELCAKVPPPQCRPLIISGRFQRLVVQMEPEVQDVARLFRMVLRGGAAGHQRLQC
ncbi:hypothetical protein CRUP_010264 [Coryphaenoides rupestris]|nr:hypothetical protein CRUP_010264 [Coryphaenoides rupestris]